MKVQWFALGIVLILIVGGIWYLQSTRTEIPPVIIKTTNQTNYSGPELVGIVEYINANSNLTIASLRGKVVLVDFWTYSCINCIRTLPFLVEWDEKYRDAGLTIIGVHTPEFDFEHEYDNVQAAVEKYDIKYPVVLDNDYQTWRAFKNKYWPHKYLIDKDGVIRYDHIGEGKYDETEEVIQELIAETGKNISHMPLSNISDLTPTQPITPELYAGYKFALSHGGVLGNDNFTPNEVVDYKLPKDIIGNVLYVEGKWLSNPGNMTSVQENASIVLRYTAASVNIVVDSPVPMKVRVLLDGLPVNKSFAGDDLVIAKNDSYMLIAEPRLYNPIYGVYGKHAIELIPERKGFTFNAFTFG